MGWEKEDPLGKADAFLARFRTPTTTEADGFPLLTDVVQTPPVQDDESIQGPTGPVEPHAREASNAAEDVRPPVAPVPEIRELVEREVRRRLELIVPVMAAEAGLIAQQILQAGMRAPDAAAPSPGDLQEALEMPPETRPGKPPQV